MVYFKKRWYTIHGIFEMLFMIYNIIFSDIFQTLNHLNFPSLADQDLNKETFKLKLETLLKKKLMYFQ